MKTKLVLILLGILLFLAVAGNGGTINNIIDEIRYKIIGDVVYAHQYSSLQAAVDAAGGREVYVSNGTYILSSPLTISNDNVTLRAASKGAILRVSADISNVISVMSASNIDITGFTFDLSDHTGTDGIRLYGTSTGKNINIHNNNFIKPNIAIISSNQTDRVNIFWNDIDTPTTQCINVYGYDQWILENICHNTQTQFGIVVTGIKNIYILNNRLWNNTADDIEFGYAADNFIVADNIMNNSRSGIALFSKPLNGVNGNITNGTLRNNKIFDPVRGGIVISTENNSNNIKNIHSYGDEVYGVQTSTWGGGFMLWHGLFTANTATIENVTIQDCTVSGSTVFGIAVSDNLIGTLNKISGCIISDIPGGIGIRMGSSNFTVKDNTVSNVQDGYKELGSPNYNRVLNNNIINTVTPYTFIGANTISTYVNGSGMYFYNGTLRLVQTT